MKTKLMITAVLTGMLACSPALAGEYATALGQCLYKNSSDADKTTLMQWAFVTLGKTDAAKSIATISAAKTQEVDQQTKTLVTRLVTTSCSTEAKQVVLKEPTTGLRDAMVAITTEMIKDKLSSSATSTFSNSLISSETATQLKETGKALNEAGQSLKNLFKK